MIWNQQWSQMRTILLVPFLFLGPVYCFWLSRKGEPSFRLGFVTLYKLHPFLNTLPVTFYDMQHVGISQNLLNISWNLPLKTDHANPFIGISILTCDLHLSPCLRLSSPYHLNLNITCWFTQTSPGFSRWISRVWFLYRWHLFDRNTKKKIEQQPQWMSDGVMSGADISKGLTPGDIPHLESKQSCPWTYFEVQGIATENI